MTPVTRGGLQGRTARPGRETWGVGVHASAPFLLSARGGSRGASGPAHLYRITPPRMTGGGGRSAAGTYPLNARQGLSLRRVVLRLATSAHEPTVLPSWNPPYLIQCIAPLAIGASLYWSREHGASGASATCDGNPTQLVPSFVKGSGCGVA